MEQPGGCLRIEQLILGILALLAASCISPQSNFQHLVTSAPTPIAPTTRTSAGSAKAVYLTQDGGTLPNSELQAHPEVIVVTSFEDFREEAQTIIALWVDKNAVDLLSVDNEWIHQPPQRYYPVVLVGYNNALYSFRDVLGGFGIEGPYMDWQSVALEPGFSVWMITEDRGQYSVSSIMRGYEEIPSVESILAITNDLLPQSLAR